MNVFENPRREEWNALLKRPELSAKDLDKKVRKILDKVRDKGDKAVRKFTQDFDGVKVKELLVSDKEIQEALSLVEDSLKEAIAQAAQNIRAFHERQVQAPDGLETMPGVHCWRKSVGIERVGLYIPGGTAPLFSTILMLAIPATIAECREIILCTPPSKDGSIHPAILYAASFVGVTKIFKCGGVQAIAAMSYGTESIPQVYKIFGPGNQYVTAAKKLVQQEGVAIDMPAGPSEVAVWADATAVPDFVAADLLSQAEHGADSQVLLVTTDKAILPAIQSSLKEQLAQLPRKGLAEKALSHSKAIVVANEEEAVDILNAYAAEHLILSCNDARSIADRIVNAGSIFIGNYSPESVGDYASGTNHTLPTNGFARAYSGVSVDSFVKKITYQQLTEDGLRAIAKTVECMAAAEGLEAHRNAVAVRLSK